MPNKCKAHRHIYAQNVPSEFGEDPEGMYGEKARQGRAVFSSPMKFREAHSNPERPETKRRQNASTLSA